MKSFFLLTILFCSCNSKNKYTSTEVDLYFKEISKNDIKLNDPLPGEWRFQHKENSQNLTNYISRNPKKAQLNIAKIYLQPIGIFSNDQQKIIELTREYLQLFFQLSTVTLDPIVETTIPDSAKRSREDGIIQLNTQYIINNLLKGKIPENGYALMAITEKDLFPSSDWNFVFGQASYSDRVGVSSMYRLGNKPLDSLGFVLCLKRIINISSHEIGHMFSIRHCILAKCVMNGANNLSETDESPNRLCSECQRKLFWNIGFNPNKRLIDLANFLKRNNLDEDYLLANQDIKTID